jgi:hypothetical protein
VANEIPKHLKQKHTKIAADQIDEIIKAVDAIPGLVHRQEELHDFQFPDAPNEAIPYLEPPRGGMLGCTTCDYLLPISVIYKHTIAKSIVGRTIGRREEI